MAEGAAQPPVQAEGILGPPAAKLAVRTERIPRQPVARPPVDALQLRVATTVGDQDGTAFERAVKLVTGQDVDLRGPATPRNGWVATGVPLGGGGWGFAAGDVRFSVSRNERARTAWRDAVWVYENIDHEVFSGRFGLMDVRRLRDAEQLTNDRMNRISTTVDEIKRMTDRVDKSNLAGSAASMLAAKLHELGEHTREQRDVLAEPPPTVPGVLHDAAEALAECGRQLSYIWWESNQVLLNAPDYEIDAVRDNINSYLSMNGLGGTGDILATLGPPPAAPGQTPEGMPSGAAPIEQIRQVLARYDSTVAGGLPAGMDPIAGDLTLPPVWDAVNAAITKRITVELDKLDRVAGLQLEKLRKAYEAVTERLAGLGQRPLDRVPTVTPPRMQTAVRQRG
jgi:hypothetical protein